MSEYHERSVTQYLLDIEIRSLLKPHLRTWMFQKEINRQFANAILTSDFEGKEVTSHMIKTCMSIDNKKLKEVDYEYVDNLFQSFEGVCDKNRPVVLKVCASYVKEKLYWKGMDYLSKNQMEKGQPLLLKAIDFTLNSAHYTNLSDSKKILKLLDSKLPKDGKYIQSTLGLVNTNSTYKGYRRSDLIQICAKPKAGKTTLMTQEATGLSAQGYHIVFASIGDNEEDDIAIKMCAYRSKTPMEFVIEDLHKHMEENQDILKNVEANSYSSGAVSIAELLADCKKIHNSRPIDILFVDYDANLSQEGESMYESGGIIYSALKGFAQFNNCVVIVGSQPKKDAWKLETLGADVANESSKKAHHVDMMITIGKNADCPTIGTVHIPLMRRGTGEVSSRVKFNFGNAEIKEISQDIYNDMLKAEKARKKGITDGGLDINDSIN